MYVTMLGTGAPLPDPDRAQSGILVTLENGARYMFDCGAGTVRNMVAANANPAEVKAVFLTHLHHDHICDFPFFTIAGWMWDRPDSPIVLGPKGTGHFCKIGCSRVAPSMPISGHGAPIRFDSKTSPQCGPTCGRSSPAWPTRTTT